MKKSTVYLILALTLPAALAAAGVGAALRELRLAPRPAAPDGSAPPAPPSWEDDAPPPTEEPTPGENVL